MVSCPTILAMEVFHASRHGTRGRPAADAISHATLSIQGGRPGERQENGHPPGGARGCAGDPEVCASVPVHRAGLLRHRQRPAVWRTARLVSLPRQERVLLDGPGRWLFGGCGKWAARK